jgi:signal transduction histidine kinase
MKRIFISFFLFVVIVFAVINYVFGPVVSSVVAHYMKQQITDYNRGLVKGVFYVVNDDLKQFSEDQWPAYINQLKPNFGFPINIKQTGEIEFTPDEQHQLDNGLIVVRGDGETFFHRIRKTSKLLVVGPVPEIETGNLWIEILIYASLIVLLGGLSILWAFPFWKKLRHISQSAVAFGNGDFNSRARVSRRSALEPLADSFNSMADQIQQLINSRKELTNAVSHELRTPIARIRFSMEMLETAPGKQERHHYIGEIQKDIDELDELVAESLAYARFDRNIPVVNLKSVQIDPWLADITAKAMRGNASLHFDHENRLAGKNNTANFDPRFMGRAIDNLIRNASMHATHRVALILDQEGQDCIVHVDDDGSGILKADRERIFNPFTRLETSRNRKYGGYGLGLAIVDRVVKWHGGHVAVSDSPLGGARFTIRWPGFSSLESTDDVRGQEKNSTP